MKTLAIALLALSLASTVFAQVYKSTDENGKTVYTDRPSNGAESVEMRETNSAPPVAVRPYTPKSNANHSAMDYQVRITSPEHDTHLPPGERNLTVSFSLNQPLVNDVRAQALVNGSPAGSSTTGSSVTLTEVARGEHNISIIIFDHDDQVLAESDPVTVYVHRTTAPKPKPTPSK